MGYMDQNSLTTDCDHDWELQWSDDHYFFYMCRKCPASYGEVI